MIDQEKVEFTGNLIALLPEDEGTVVRTTKNINGEEVQILAIEFNHQTVQLYFTFDSDDEQDQALAELVARGAKLLEYFLGNALRAEYDRQQIIDAFHTTFNVLMRDVDASRYMVDQSSPNPTSEEPPTVGEK